MRIICEKGEFELPASFPVEYLQNNVLVSENGEQTVPATLPASGHNLSLLEYSNRIDALYKPLSEMDVQIIDPAFVCPANMVINSIDEEEGINMTLYIDSGGFYSKIDETKLADLTWDVIDPDVSDKTGYLIDLLKNQYSTRTADDRFHVAPVLTDCQYRHKAKVFVWKDGQNTLEDQILDRQLMLNGFLSYDTYYPWAYRAHDFDFFMNRFEGEREQIHVVDDREIVTKKGYGMSPFLKLSYVLTRLFEYYDLSFSYQDISGPDPQLVDVCLLNNVADAIYSGILRFKYLLPDMTIKEFLDEIEKILCGKFVIDFIVRQAVFVYYPDALNKEADMDLTPFLASHLKPDMPDFKDCVLSTTDEEQTSRQVKSKNIEKIELALKKMTHTFVSFAYETQYYETFEAYDGALFITFNVGNITHKNSIIKFDDNETEPETKEKSADNGLMLANFPAKLKSSDPFLESEVGRFTYYGADYFFYDSIAALPEPGLYEIEDLYKITDLQVEEARYLPYVNFLAHSNIRLTGQMSVPNSILNTIKLHTPKLICGQRVFIEQIKRILDKETGTIELTFRTLREYKDRK